MKHFLFALSVISAQLAVGGKIQTHRLWRSGTDIITRLLEAQRLTSSLTRYVQRDSPGRSKENNWLPAPKSGEFSMNLRLYWPKPEALDGTWKPPALKRVD